MIFIFLNFLSVANIVKLSIMSITLYGVNIFFTDLSISARVPSFLLSAVCHGPHNSIGMLIEPYLKHLPSLAKLKTLGTKS